MINFASYWQKANYCLNLGLKVEYYRVLTNAVR